MPPFASSALPTWMLQVLPVAFLAITFLQSGLDKVINWKGNLDWQTGYFSKTPVLRGLVLPMFATLMVLELAAGGLCAAGVLALIFTGNSWLAVLGASVSGVIFLALLFGQRIVKDYPGAAGSVPYFLVSLAALFALRG
ncbi:DoxX family protein [Stigmatella hybrida]|uniref:DoxX family protein n=1 Tax=Stigmatella hybrida TaxID=394097 RepID=UPI001CDB2332|nr:DoxX family protein [Stigmatella hybrida]